MELARRADFTGKFRSKYCVAALPFGSAQGPEPVERGAQRPAVAKPMAGKQRGRTTLAQEAPSYAKAADGRQARLKNY